jgi:hypothetical protein
VIEIQGNKVIQSVAGFNSPKFPREEMKGRVMGAGSFSIFGDHPYFWPAPLREVRYRGSPAPAKETLNFQFHARIISSVPEGKNLSFSEETI